MVVVQQQLVGMVGLGGKVVVLVQPVGDIVVVQEKLGDMVAVLVGGMVGLEGRVVVVLLEHPAVEGGRGKAGQGKAVVAVQR